MSLPGVPDAKRVRRSELYPSTFQRPTSTQPDAELDAVLREKLKKVYGDIAGPESDSVTGIHYSGSASTDIHGRETPSSRLPCTGGSMGRNVVRESCMTPDWKEGILETEGVAVGDATAENRTNNSPSNVPELATCFDFRLFSSSSASKVHGVSGHAPTPRIVLDPDIDWAAAGDGGFCGVQRPLEYYIATAAEGARKREFEDAAMTGEAVRLWQKVRYTGLEVPWRVKTVVMVPPNGRGRGKPVEGRATDVGDDDGCGRKARKKPGKKRRVILRMRSRAAEDERERKRKEEMEKEERHREKKTRKNREKKVKRKQKMKATKNAAATTVALVNSDSSIK